MRTSYQKNWRSDRVLAQTMTTVNRAQNAALLHNSIGPAQC